MSNPNRTIKLVTDSTADLPAELRERYDVTMVPLNLHFGTETYLEQVEMTSAEFFTKIGEPGVELPKSSQPSPGAFAEVYRKLGAEGASIISIHLSGGLSGTVQSAEIAKAMLPELDIHIVDTKSASMGTGLIVLEAARAREEGLDAPAIVARLHQTMERMWTLLTVDSLEWLHRNGRIGRAAALFGSMLNLKPLLEVAHDGIIRPVEKVRGRGKVISRMVEFCREKVPVGSKLCFAIMHGDCEDDARKLYDLLAVDYQVEFGHVGFIGPVIGTHTGPGTIGFIFHRA
ncbi:MAG: DegV family protein [Bacillota bacterium]